MCLLSKYLGLHKINGRKGEGAHCRVAVTTQFSNSGTISPLEKTYPSGLVARPGSSEYSFISGEMVPEFENCVVSLEFNELGFVESDFGYHIIKRLPLEKTDLADKVESSIKSKKLSDAMAEWKTQAGFVVTKNDSVFADIS